MSCGGCTFCCKFMGVVELGKVDGVWCDHACYGKGCGIYESRPQSCRDFQCYYRFTQDSTNPQVKMPIEFRPDVSRVMIIDMTDKVVCAKCDPAQPLAFKRQPMFTFLYQMAINRRVIVTAGRRVFEVLAPQVGLMTNNPQGYRELNPTEFRWVYGDNGTESLQIVVEEQCRVSSILGQMHDMKR